MNKNRPHGVYTNLIAPRGTNLRSNRRLISPLLSSALSETAMFLRRCAGDNPTLFRYDDWWEHDGLHLPRKDELIDFDVLFSLVETPQSLEAAMTGDLDVVAGVAPPNFQWYLRFYLETESSGSSAREREGRFDITLPEHFVEDYCQQVVAPLALQMQAQDSLAYYVSIGMGSYPYS
ncbi:MAG: hypothetical protein V4671_33550 [Armatimonadota bacterium]